MSIAGRALYNLWHRPIAAMRNTMRHGGFSAVRSAEQGRRAMEEAALELPPLPLRGTSPHEQLEVHLLSGGKFASQTAFCIHTLGRNCPIDLRVDIYDDGSLDTKSQLLLKRLSPCIQIHGISEIEGRLNETLPANRFPTLRERWVNYPHIRKLIDIHAGKTGWRLVLDSDLLFWREPRFLIEWARQPDRPLVATDCVENYGYPRNLLDRIANRTVAPLVNVGICGLQSEGIDWDFLEASATTLIRENGTSYYLEQALVALLVSRLETYAAASASEYLTMPTLNEIEHPTAVMHHYVDISRGDYYRTAWRKAFPDS